MAPRTEQEPVGVAAGIAIVVLWFQVGVAALEVLFGALTPDPNLRFLSAVAGLVYAAIAIGLQRRSPAAAVWGVALSALSCGIGLGTGQGVLGSQLLILIPLLVVAIKPRRAARFEPPQPSADHREGPQAVWFPGPMDDPLLARLRLPRDWK